MKWFVIISVLICLRPLSVVAQSTICLGVNCPDAVSDSQNPFLGDDDLYADELLARTVELSKLLGTFDDEKDECYKECKAEYLDGQSACDVSTRLNDWGRSRHDKLYAICIEYERERYVDCLNPFRRCNS